MARKLRSDRNYVIYRLTCVITGRQYVGVVVAQGRAYQRSVKNRFKAHTRNAMEYGHQTVIADAIRHAGAKAFRREVVAVVRGKQNAHDFERALIKRLAPALNMEGMGRKVNSIEEAATVAQANGCTLMGVESITGETKCPIICPTPTRKSTLA